MNSWFPPPTPRDSDWTAAEVDSLYQGIAAGRSAREIAAGLSHRSRDAVLGKVFRLKQNIQRKNPLWSAEDDALLGTMPTVTIAAQTGRSIFAVWNRVARLRGGARGDDYRQITRPPRAAPRAIQLEPEPPPPEGSKTFMELARSGECKYPYGDPQKWDEFRYCGQQSGERSYCPAHHAVAHRQAA